MNPLTLSLIPSLPPIDGSATQKEKMELLQILERRATKLLEIVEVSQRSIAQLSKQVAINLVSIKRIKDFLSEILPSIHKNYKEIKNLIEQLKISRAPILKNLEFNLNKSDEELKNFKEALSNLLNIKIHPALKDFLARDIPVNEMTGTLYDWANVPQLCELEKGLIEGHQEMRELFEWANAEGSKICTQYEFLAEDYQNIVQEVEIAQNSDVNYREKLTIQNNATNSFNLIYSDIQSHLEKIKSSIKEGNINDLENICAIDRGNPSRVAEISASYSSIKDFHRETGLNTEKLTILFNRSQKFARISFELIKACKIILEEFSEIERDVQNYFCVPDEANGYLQLKKSVMAWKRFIDAYEDLMNEIRRRKEERDRQIKIFNAIIEQLTQIQKLEEGRRKKFIDKYSDGKSMPIGWLNIDLLKESIPKFTIIREDEETILPDLDSFVPHMENTSQDRKDVTSICNSLEKSIFQLQEGNRGPSETQNSNSTLFNMKANVNDFNESLRDSIKYDNSDFGFNMICNNSNYDDIINKPAPINNSGELNGFMTSFSDYTISETYSNSGSVAPESFRNIRQNNVTKILSNLIMEYQPNQR